VFLSDCLSLGRQLLLKLFLLCLILMKHGMSDARHGATNLLSGF